MPAISELSEAQKRKKVTTSMAPPMNSTGRAPQYGGINPGGKYTKPAPNPMPGPKGPYLPPDEGRQNPGPFRPIPTGPTVPIPEHATPPPGGYNPVPNIPMLAGLAGGKAEAMYGTPVMPNTPRLTLNATQGMERPDLNSLPGTVSRDITLGPGFGTIQTSPTQAFQPGFGIPRNRNRMMY